MRTKPFLKWAGNKFGLLSHIVPLLPEGKRLVEPFAGSAAVFLNTNYSQTWLNDFNPHLTTLFEILAKDGDLFIKATRRYFGAKFNMADAFYRLRSRFNSTTDDFERARLFLYLNRHCYNGLCRYNKSGAFNVPFGRYKKPYFPKTELEVFAKKARQAKITCLDFEDVLNQVGRGDVVYCDPPYSPLSATAYFTDYSAGGFGEADHIRLAEAAKRSAKKGATAVVSNHDTPLTRDLYQAAILYAFEARRNISCDATQRNDAPELLALFTAEKPKRR